MPLPPSRKRPHSQAGTTPGESTNSRNNVKVVVRIRPPNSKETEGNFREVVQAVDENVLVFDPKENEYSGVRKRPRDIRKRRNKDLNFAFDYVFGPSATNTEIYNETTNTVLTGLLDGYNCSVFAYGATGAGKTFTMLGSKDQPGVMYHTMMDLYSRIDGMKDTKTCDVAISYLEVYNETIRDLLMPGSALPIREDPGQGVVIQGLSLHKPKTAEELLYMLQYGNQNRTQHPTDANAESSRSHAVLQVFVRQTDRTANISAEVRIAKLCLVDLAGSERATATKNMGSRFREGANINKSLLALGNVINALAENKTKGFIPYRDSKLTRLLKDSLGGNCQTVMIAAVSPSSMTYEDTYNTLRYADRAKHIKATLKKNVLNVDFHMAKYGKIVEELRKEIFELKGKLKNYEDRKIAPTQNVGPVESVSYSEHQNKIKDFYVSHQAVKCNQLENEITLRNLQWKMYRKQRCLSRLSTVNEPGNIESVKAIETMVNGMNQKCSSLSLSSDSSRSLLTDSYKSLGDLEQNMYDSCALPDNSLPEAVCLSLKIHDLQVQLSDSKQQMSYYRQVVRCQEKELVHNERLIHFMLKLLKKQHYIIKGHDIMTSDLSEEYSDVQRKVSGQELYWKDQVDSDVYVKGYTLSTMLDLPSLKLMKEDFVQAHKDEKRNSKKDGNTKNAIYQFTATQCAYSKPVLSYPTKVVDECSPPKAKRVCLENKAPVSIRMDKSSQQTVQRKMNRSVTTPKKSYLTPSKSQSFCVSRSMYNNSKKIKDNRVSQTSSQSKSSSTLAKMNNQRELSSVNSSSEVTSPDSKEFSNSKFSKLNDTISKKKKFTHVNTKCQSSSQEVHNSDNNNGDVHDLDGTFTIDPSVNSIPVSSIPCVDCNNTIQCNKCTLLKDNNTQSVMNDGSKESTDDNMNNKQSDAMHSWKIETFCDKDVDTVRAQMYTSCIDEVPTGSQDGPENESGVSTIVNQSSNSVTSLTSMSTLVDGQNLSQNLSIEDSSNISVVQNDDKTCGTVSKTSYTVTNTTSNHVQQSDTVLTSYNSNSVHLKKNKAIRSIKFDSTQNDVISPTGEKKDKKSTVSACKIVKERKPLSLVGTCNTSLTSPRRDSCSSITLSDSDSSFTKQSTNDKYVLSSSLTNDIQCKENSCKLSQHGLPSLVSSSILCSTNKSSGVMKRSSSRGYLQATKAHMNRSKLTTSKPHVRSKSVSNVPSRAAWQI